ncbi:MAG TPA: GDP-mannose 4,6-dehydratase [Patescibacteria group bacterium]|nr:GDP-mannose 4,6-dehydratase [Patescibacteria group bacterium]
MQTDHKKRVLVTGAAGFLGSHLVDRMLVEGNEVVGIDNLITGLELNLEDAKKNNAFTFVNADVIAPPETYLPDGFTPDLIFHLASPASPPRYQQHPVETYLVNSLGTHNLLQYILSSTPEARFVYASTSEVYGDPKEHPQKETYWGNVNPNGIRSCYDESKRYGEMVCGVHNRDFDVDVRIMRIFNTYGPRMNPVDGRAIPNFVQWALKNEPMQIYGDGSQTRSLCYVDDLIEGITLLATIDSARGETVNLGNPYEVTMLQLAELIKKATGSTSVLEHGHPMPGDDPTRRKPDISKAKSLLNWEPKVSFEEGLGKTVEYFKQTMT